jgi:carbonic anhydrase
VLAEAIAPAARETAHDSRDRVRNAVAANVRLAVQRLKAATPIMAHAVNSREIEVVGGVYDLSTGKVSLL